MDINASAFWFLILIGLVTILGLMFSRIENALAALFLIAAVIFIASASGYYSTARNWNTISNIFVFGSVSIQGIWALGCAFKAGQQSVTMSRN